MKNPEVSQIALVAGAGSLTVEKIMQTSGVAFGTSGARGLVTAMTDAVCFAYVTGYLKHLAEVGEFRAGTPVALAGDLRPSSPRILAACVAAVRTSGGQPVYCGLVPSPAVALHGFTQGVPSLMVTGSHIPDDRNGIKFNRVGGEILKPDEEGIRRQSVALPEGLFDAAGAFRSPEPLPATPDVDAVTPYVQRYVDFLGGEALRGMRVGVYQHSAVARDLLVTLLQALGAMVVPLGRASSFIPVDTEAVRPEDVALAREWAAQQPLDAIVSTDGDSDRPLIADEHGEWLRGDVVGILCARFVGATCVATPVSSNTALEKSGWFKQTLRTRIGSPYVIEAMLAGLADGQPVVCGYEANGGFLLASAVRQDGRTLAPLPTRDAVLPILSVLVGARRAGLTVSALQAALPRRFTHSDRLKDFPTALSQRKLAELQVGDLAARCQALSARFGAVSGTVTGIDTTDGLRMTFANAEVIHLRPSGNAPELRCYSEADTAERARVVNELVLAQLDGWRQAA